MTKTTEHIILFPGYIVILREEIIMPLLLIAAVIAFIIVFTAVYKIHPLPVLLLGAFLFGVLSRYGVLQTLDLISGGFGNTIRSIGIVIIAGTVIGVFMEKRGALKIIAQKIIALTGEKRTPLAMSLIGFVVSICIFCDSAFIILVGLWKKIGKLAKLPLAVGAAALSMGLFASHCFIPPTPGPLAAIAVLDADFSKVLLFGTAAALAATIAGYFYVSFAGKNEVLENVEESDPAKELPEELFHRHWSVAFLPVLIPLMLIAAGALAKVFRSSLPEKAVTFITIAGTPVIALAIGAVISIFFLGQWKKDELSVDGLMGKAVLDAANILVITGAGGAFGEVLKKVDFTTFLPEKVSAMGVWILLLPLGFAALLKTAQGSSTLAILTAASITAPLLEPLGLTTPVMRALVCCAVCCGSMIVSHTNDSYFWVVTKFSGMSVRQGLKLQTLGTLVSGLAAAAVLMIMALIYG